MPFVQPSRSDVHVDFTVSQISLAFIQDNDAYVANRVFPEVPVSHQSNKYFTFDRGEFNRSQMKRRAPGTKVPRATRKLSTDNYLCDVFNLGQDVPDEIRANADSALDSDRETGIFLAGQALLNLETGWRDTYFTSGAPGDTWTFDVDGAATASLPGVFDPTDAANNQKLFWDDGASTPIEDVRQGKRFVQSVTGFRPNVMTAGREVFDILVDHPDIVGRLDRGQTDGPAMANADSLAALFDLEEIVIMDAIENTAGENLPAVHNFIGGKHALLSYRPPAAGLMTPSAGYTFRWTGMDRSVPEGAEVEFRRDDEAKTDVFEIFTAYDQKLVSADLGYFFGDIVQ